MIVRPSRRLIKACFLSHWLKVFRLFFARLCSLSSYVNDWCFSGEHCTYLGRVNWLYMPLVNKRPLVLGQERVCPSSVLLTFDVWARYTNCKCFSMETSKTLVRLNIIVVIYKIIRLTLLFKNVGLIHLIIVHLYCSLIQTNGAINVY